MRSVGILLFDEVEVLDACGPFEVFSVASRVSVRDGAHRPFSVMTMASSEMVRARHGLELKSQYYCSDHPPIDVLIVPGGVVTAPRSDPKLIDWISRTAAACEVVASVCTGSFLLAEAGLLRGIRATTHWEDIEEMQASFPSTEIDPTVRWTRTGKTWTSAGISAGLDMSLSIIADLEGISLARRTARQMDYKWRESPQ